MKRTQVQLPDRLYDELKKMARRHETSLADIIRKAGEYYLSRHPDPDGETLEWDIPEPDRLGEFLSADTDWRLLANEDGERT